MKVRLLHHHYSLYSQSQLAHREPYFLALPPRHLSRCTANLFPAIRLPQCTHAKYLALSATFSWPKTSLPAIPLTQFCLPWTSPPGVGWRLPCALFCVLASPGVCDSELWPLAVVLFPLSSECPCCGVGTGEGVGCCCGGPNCFLVSCSLSSESTRTWCVVAETRSVYSCCEREKSVSGMLWLVECSLVSWLKLVWILGSFVYTCTYTCTCNLYLHYAATILQEPVYI